jgi:hypothetical protein
MISVLVLGHTGVFGRSLYSHLCQLDDIEVLGYSRSDITVANHSLTVPVTLHELLITYQPNVIVNCIGEYRNKSLFVKTNYEFVSLLLLLVSKSYLPHKLPTFIQLSSMGVLAPYAPIFATNDLNSYEFSKYLAENLIRTYSLFTPQKIILVQPSTILSVSSPFLRRLFLLYLLSPFNLVSSNLIIPCISIKKLTHLVSSIIACDASFNSSALLNTHLISKPYSLYFFHRLFLRYSRPYRFIASIRTNLPYYLLLPRSITKHIPCKPFSITLSRYKTLSSR